MPQLSNARLPEESSFRRRYRWDQRLGVTSAKPNIMFGLPMSMLAVVAFYQTLHICLVHFLKGDRGDFVPWQYIQIWGVSLNEFMTFINVLFAIYVVLDAIVRWQQNRAHWLWQAGTLLICLHIFVILHYSFGRIDNESAYWAKRCESVLEPPMNVDLPTIAEVQPPNRSFDFGVGTLWDAQTHIRVSVNGIVMNDEWLGAYPETITVRPFSDTSRAVQLKLVQHREQFIQRLPEYLKERAGKTIFVNISADRDLPFRVLKALLQISNDAGFTIAAISVRETFCENVFFELPPVVPSEDWIFDKEKLSKESHIMRISLDSDGNVLVHRRLKNGVSFKTPVNSLLDRLEKIRKAEPESAARLIEVPVYRISDAAKIEDVLRLLLNTYEAGQWGEYQPPDYAVIANEPPVVIGGAE